MSNEAVERPRSYKKTDIQKAKVDGFYLQYSRAIDSFESIADWATDEDIVNADTAAKLGLDDSAWFLSTEEKLANPVVYLRDLDYTPLAYLVAPGVVTYVLPQTYKVPSLLSKAKIQPDLEVESVLYKLAASIIGKDYYKIFEAYHEAMLYGFSDLDLGYAGYTKYYWQHLNHQLQGSEKLREKLDKALTHIAADGYTIGSIGLYLKPFIETALKSAMTEGI